MYITETETVCVVFASIRYVNVELMYVFFVDIPATCSGRDCATTGTSSLWIRRVIIPTTR